MKCEYTVIRNVAFKKFKQVSAGFLTPKGLRFQGLGMPYSIDHIVESIEGPVFDCLI